jgi:hypothetical protein
MDSGGEEYMMIEILKKMAPQNFNDTLCLVLIILTVALWIMTGQGIVTLPESVVGATIVTWTLLVQYYFRKKSNEGG